MTENKLVDDAPEACPSLADTAAAVAEGQIAQALCGETLCPLPAEEGYSPDMESYEAVYSWGTARFVIKKAGGSPVLYALDTTNEKMTAPRTTKIGMSAKDVMAKFRDLNNPPLDSQGKNPCVMRFAIV